MGRRSTAVNDVSPYWVGLHRVFGDVLFMPGIREAVSFDDGDDDDWEERQEGDYQISPLELHLRLEQLTEAVKQNATEKYVKELNVMSPGRPNLDLD